MIFAGHTVRKRPTPPVKCGIKEFLEGQILWIDVSCDHQGMFDVQPNGFNIFSDRAFAIPGLHDWPPNGYTLK